MLEFIVRNLSRVLASAFPINNWQCPLSRTSTCFQNFVIKTKFDSAANFHFESILDHNASHTYKAVSSEFFSTPHQHSFPSDFAKPNLPNIFLLTYMGMPPPIRRECKIDRREPAHEMASGQNVPASQRPANQHLPTPHKLPETAPKLPWKTYSDSFKTTLPSPFLRKYNWHQWEIQREHPPFNKQHIFDTSSSTALKICCLNWTM